MRPYRKKKELANWIRRKLGAPVVDVIIDTTQIDDCIDQACDYFGEFASGVGNENTIILISPEPVYYDGTGSVNQPGPTAGRWRKPVTTECLSTTAAGTTGTTGTTACPPTDCEAINTTHIPKPLGACENPKPTSINGVCCPEESPCRGPGWCGDGIQPDHCFTQTEKGDPEAEGPFWIEGDTTGKPSKQGFLFKSIYDIPSNIIALHAHLGAGYFGTQAYDTQGEALFSPLHLLLGGGGSWGMQSPTAWVDNRYGYWHGGQGGFVDVVGWEMGMQYLEMFRTLYTTKLDVQLLELEHKVRITPAPTAKGIIAIAATAKVADDYMYEHQFVREYALALCLVQIGMNAGKYTGITLPGGGSVNFEMYLSRGDALREKLEQQINDGQWSVPSDFYLG